jgi:hypothetical protein
MNADSMDVKVNMIIECPLNTLTIKTVRTIGIRNGENAFNILERIPIISTIIFIYTPPFNI